jgi:hypothetical protein
MSKSVSLKKVEKLDLEVAMGLQCNIGVEE